MNLEMRIHRHTARLVQKITGLNRVFFVSQNIFSVRCFGRGKRSSSFLDERRRLCLDRPGALHREQTPANESLVCVPASLGFDRDDVATPRLCGKNRL